jgi:conjugal transfer ATP-binding protein TraC
MLENILKPAHSRISDFLRRNAPSEFLSPLSFEEGCFILEDGYIGNAYLCEPLSGCDEQTVQKLEALYSLDLPNHSFIQVALYGLDDIDSFKRRFRIIRNEKAADERKDLFRADTTQTIDFLEHHTKTPLNENSGLLIRNFQVIISVKIPCKEQPPSADDIQICQTLDRTIFEVIKSTGLSPLRMNGDMWLHIMRNLFNWNDDNTWKGKVAKASPSIPLREQVFEWGKGIRVDKNGIIFDNKCAKILSVQQFPDTVVLPQMYDLVGDWRTGRYGIRENMAIILNLYFPPSDSTVAKLDRNRQTINFQATGPLQKWVPKLMKQKASHDALYESLSEGGRVLKAHLHFMLLADDMDKLDAAIANMKTYYKTNHFHVQEETWASIPLFHKALPFGPEKSAVEFSKRYQTITSREAAEITPVLSDWKGTGTPVLNFVSRNGQLMHVDLFDAATNFNAAVAAKSGSGKSFLINEVIMSYMGSAKGKLGGRVWTIDVGRSYEKMCEALGGEFICFDENANFSLNPFPVIRDWNEEVDMTLEWIFNMATTESEPLTSVQTSSISRHVNSLWEQLGAKLDITIIADSLLADDDPRVKDVGTQLYPFTERGPYGRYFSNKYAPIKMDNDFVVLELEELKGRKHLQSVVLLQLISRISNEMYLGARDRRKLLILDEAWEFLKGGSVGKFLETGYRRFRKYGASAICITQSINDLYSSESGRAIAENSSNMFLLAQKAETLDAIKAEKRLSFSDGLFEVLKTVHTEPFQYSEIFFYTELGCGIGRLYVNRFKQLLYSTMAEEVQKIRDYTSQGLTVSQAIGRIIEEESSQKRISLNESAA